MERPDPAAASPQVGGAAPAEVSAEVPAIGGGAREYIDGLEQLGWRLGLERVTRLVQELGDPQKAYRTIHVVGTNGKSSTTRFISALLEEQGLKVGAYVSPHLVSLAERQMVDSVPSTEEEFCSLVERVRAAAERVENALPEGERLTQFEVLTAAALLHFKESGCDVAVIEAGLGGRLDATAVISSEVQVLTSIGLEHTELLGDTRIGHPAREGRRHPRRGGGGSGRPESEVKSELKEYCGAREASCYFLGDQVVVLADPRRVLSTSSVSTAATPTSASRSWAATTRERGCGRCRCGALHRRRTGCGQGAFGPRPHHQSRAGWRSSAPSRCASSTVLTTPRGWRRP